MRIFDYSLLEDEPGRFETDRDDRNIFCNNTLTMLSEKDEKDPELEEENTTEIDFTTLKEQIENHIENGEFHKTFVLLKILKDHYRGITTKYLPNPNEKYPLLVRNAIHQEENHQHEASHEASSYSYIILGLNCLSGLKDLLKIRNDKQGDINLNAAYQDITTAALQYYKAITSEEKLAPQHFGDFYHNFILPFYRQYAPELTKKQAINHLRIARDFANMKSDSYAVVTISKIKVIAGFQKGMDYKKSIHTAELDLPLLQLTDKQLTMYRNRENLDWYKNQPEIIQSLIDEHVEEILQGKIIPSQLIYHLIGSRNAYEKVTAKLNDDESYEIINRTYHAGSQAHLFKLSNEKFSIREKATKLNLEQLRKATGAKELGITTLVSSFSKHLPWKDYAVEKQIHTATAEVDKAHTHYSALPLNFLRPISKRNLSGVKNFKNTANHILNIKNDSGYAPRHHIEEYLNDARNDFPEKQYLSLLPLYFCTEKLNALIEKAESLNPLEKLFYDGDNYNLQIAATVNQIVYWINEIGHYGSHAQVSGCLSGQDRGGMLSSHTTTESIYHALKTNNPHIKNKKTQEEQKNNIYTAVAQAGHTQEMASGPGTGHGGEGIKWDSKYVIPKSYPKETTALYCKKTAKYNEHTPKNPGASTSIYKLPKLRLSKEVNSDNYSSESEEDLRRPILTTSHKSKSKKGSRKNKKAKASSKQEIHKVLIEKSFLNDPYGSLNNDVAVDDNMFKIYDQNDVQL